MEKKTMVKKKNYMTYAERLELGKLYLAGLKPQEIAASLNRNKDAIYKELKRGAIREVDKNFRIAYCPDTAHRLYKKSLSQRGSPYRWWKSENK